VTSANIGKMLLAGAALSAKLKSISRDTTMMIHL
jgi:hypothetical protein